MFDVNEKIYNNIINEIKKNGYINVMLFDTETTGIESPEITQLGYIIEKITLDENNNFIFEEIDKNEDNYYVTKKIEPDAVRITHIIREEDLNDKKYITTVIKSFADNKEKITVAKIKKSFLLLNKSLKIFEPEDFKNIVKKYNIKSYAGHNIYQYDCKEVLENKYGIKVPTVEIFDTILTDIHNKKVKTNQGRKLSNEVKKILPKLNSELQKFITEQISTREDEAHSALLDIEVNKYLFQHQLESMKKDLGNTKQIENTYKNNNDRNYKNGDILFIRTNMSEDNIITEEQIFNYCKENEIKTIILSDKQWTRYIKLSNKFKELGIKLIIGFQAYNIDTNTYTDIIIKDTLNYRLLLPLIKEGHQVTNERLKDILKYTKNIVIPSKKMPTPKYLEKEDSINFFLSNKILQNEAFTQQELELYKDEEKIDESLKTGLYTSDIKQKWFKEKIKDFETPNFSFYSDLGLSAFPPLNILHPAIKKEPETIEEAIKMLENFYNEQWELRKLDEIIKKSGLPKELYEERKEKEFSIMKKIGKIDFIKYFFLVYKIGNIMEGNITNDILDEDNPNFKIIREAFGYGRGSAPGSLIAFVTGTTGLDPLKYDLLFERFIDPSRPDYPDIDLDIVNKEFAFNILKQYFDKETPKYINYNSKPYDIYDEYILEKYIKPNKNFIGKIKTVAYTTPKVVLGSILRLNQKPYFIQSIISKEFDTIIKENGGSDKNILLEDIVERSEVKNDITKSMSLDIFKSINNLKNIYKSSGIHAGGVLFFPHHNNVILPMKNNVVEFDMRDLESLLQIKMDLLGLKTREAIEEIKLLLKKTGKEELIYKHNFDDMTNPEVYLGYFLKHTAQTFQMGSAGMDKLLYSLSPLRFEDIVAVTALFRPGPLGSGAVDSYVSSAIKAKREKYKIIYIPEKEWEKMEPVSKEALLEQYRNRMEEDFNKIMLKDELIINIITTEDYFESQKFQKMIENKFNSTDSELIQEIKAKYHINDQEEFKKIILDFENKISNDESFKSITSDTYHTMVYQEQIMFISVQMANYTVLESNKLRKAIAKQNKEQMDIQKVKFIKGIISPKIKKVFYKNEYEKYEISKTQNNEIALFNKETNEYLYFPGFLEINGEIKINEYTPEKLIKLIQKLNNQVKEGVSEIKIEESSFSELEAKYFWDKIESFGAYAFNKSHAASYSVYTYETQYYKEVAPTIAYGVYLKHVPEKAKMQLIKEIKNRGIGLELQTLDNNINTSFNIDIKRDVIALPLTYIKGIGDKEILPFIELFKDYNIENIEEMLLFSGAKARKKITERLGQLGVFEKSNKSSKEPFSIISAKEWYYLSGENENPDDKGMLHRVIEKAIKNIKIQRKYKKVLSNVKEKLLTEKIGVEIEDILPNIWLKNSISESLQTLKVLSDSLSSVTETSDKNKEDDKKILKFYTDIQKAQAILDTELIKFKETKNILEHEVTILEKAIENKEYDFYKTNNFKKGFEIFKTILNEEIKPLAKELRETIIENYNNQEIKEKLINIIGEEESKIRILNAGEQSDINDKLLKEGNFDNNIDFNYKTKEDTVNLKDVKEETLYNKFFVTSDKKIKEENQTNVIYLTEFLPKVSKEGFESAHYKYGSKTQQFFLDLYKKIPGKKKEEIKIAWMSYHSMTEPQYKEKFIDNYVEKEELEEYNNDRFKKIILKIADSSVENIIVATQPKSKLMGNIKKYKFKGFDPQYGDTAIVYLKNSSGEKVKKIFGFVPNMFPYKDLNEKKYEEDLNMITKILGVKEE